MSIGYAATIAAYVALAAAAVVLETLGRRPGGTVPTFSDLVTAVAATAPFRFVLLGLWWWAGWHFLARSSVPPGWPYP
ncbi:MAG: DUF6186 family protein [Actinomycetota bacterium]|nr:DUF6186 family protein [Actinomycetota bacterium]